VAASGAHTGSWFSRRPSSIWNRGVTSVALRPDGPAGAHEIQQLGEPRLPRPELGARAAETASALSPGRLRRRSRD